MNTWEYMQFAKANPDLFPDYGPQWTSEGGLLSLGRSEENPFKDMSAKDILAIGSSAPGRIGQVYSALASGSTPTDRAMSSKLYDIMQTATPDERAWLAKNPQWMLLNGQLEDAGLIESTDKDPIGKYWGPLYRTMVTAIIGAGAAGAVGAATGATSGTGLFGLGPELGLSGPWGGEALAGSAGADVLAGGATGDALSTGGTSWMAADPSTFAFAGPEAGAAFGASGGSAGLFNTALASATPTLGGVGVMEGLSALGPLGIPESIASGAASTSSIIDVLKNNPTLTKALASGASGLIKYFGSQAALDKAADAAKQLQQQTQFAPYNVTGPAGSAMFNGQNLTLALSPEQQGLAGQFKGAADKYYGDISGFNTNEYVQNYLGWMRDIASEYDARNLEQLQSKALNTGMLGGPAGSRLFGEYYKRLNDADLQRQMTAESAGLNRMNTMYNLFNTSAGNYQNLLNQPYNYAALGINAGGARSGANVQAAQFPWAVSGAQAAGTSGLWSELAGGLNNAVSSWLNPAQNTGAETPWSKVQYNRLMMPAGGSYA